MSRSRGGRRPALIGADRASMRQLSFARSVMSISLEVCQPDGDTQRVASSGSRSEPQALRRVPSLLIRRVSAPESNAVVSCGNSWLRDGGRQWFSCDRFRTSGRGRHACRLRMWFKQQKCSPQPKPPRTPA
ncbi:hypothetical protein HNR05_001891 [Leifsonia psychrotolerans]|uniref:Uncharacterized protein n=1 Tax=Glaciibacter psychrotolerans TaxID=670054 RepID=A0A7Z0EEJ4_9MICO|nr:hypothetical protein [Leifsonia psychrotolerans]